MKITEAINKLNTEAERYRDLAKDAAIASIACKDNEPCGMLTHEKRRLAQDHLIRAESFKAAAALISPNA